MLVPHNLGQVVGIMLLPLKSIIMKELRLSIAINQVVDGRFSTSVEGRKATELIKAQISLSEKSAIKSTLNGADYALSSMRSSDIARCLKLAASYAAEQRASHKEEAKAFAKKRAKLTWQNAKADMHAQACQMVEETFFYLKDNLPKAESYGETKCLLKGLASQAGRQVSEAKGLDKVFYRLLSRVLWTSEAVRWMLATPSEKSNSSEYKAWEKLTECIWK